MTSQTTITCGLSSAFINKPLRPGHDITAYSNSFLPSEGTVEQLFDHITGGNAWTPAVIKNRRRVKENFVSSQIIGLDFDDDVSVEDALNYPSIKRYAAIVHPSPSSTPEKPKTRVVFILDTTVEDVERYEAYIRATMHHHDDLKPDPSAKDAVRFFFGSTVPGAVLRADLRLPLSVLETWRKDYAAHLDAELEKTRHQAPGNIVSPQGTRADRYAAATYNNILDAVRSAQKGNRNNALYKASLKLHSRLTWPGFDELSIECDLLDAARVSGLIADKGENAALATIRSARNAASQVPLEIKETTRPGRRGGRAASEDEPQNFTIPADVELDAFTADVCVNMRWCSEIDLTARTILLKAVMATGKTTAYAKHIKASGAKRVLILTRLASLSEDLARRLNEITGLSFEHYRSVVQAGYGDSLGSISYLVCSLDQLPKLADVEPYEVVVWDESVSGLEHLIQGGTLKDENIRAYQNAKQIIANAGQFIATDAHLTDLHADVFRKFRDDVTCIHNTYTHNWGNIEIFSSKSALLDTSFRCIDDNQDRCTVIACGSRKLARMVERDAIKRFGEAAVATIHGRKGHTATAFRRDLNATIQAVRVLIVTSSVGDGYDVQENVAGVFGIFDNEPLPADPALQMMFRYRNADRRAAYVYPHEASHETDIDSLFARHYMKAHKTARYADFNAEKLSPVTPVQSEMLHTWARIKSAANRQKNNLRGYFIALAKQQGCHISWRFDDGHYDLKASLEALEAADIERVQTVEAVTKEGREYLIRQGEYTEDHDFGYRRWQIEQHTGESITEETAKDYLFKPREQSALRRFTDLLYADRHELQARDRAQAKRVLYRRDHHTLGYDLMKAAIQAVFGDDGLASDEHIDAFELRRRLDGFFTCERLEILEAIDGRTDLSKDIIAAFKRLLKRYHIVVKADRKRIIDPHTGENTPVQVYYLDAARLEIIRARAAKCREMMEKQAVEFTDKHKTHYANSTQSTSYSLSRQSQPPETGQRRRKSPPGTGDGVGRIPF